MKRLIVVTALLLAMSTLFAAQDAGRIGVQFDYSGYLESDSNPVNAQELILSVSGSNFFDKIECLELDTPSDMDSHSMD